MTCSAESERLGEATAGSAPYAVAWVALEQDGPWGAKAFTSSHLDPALGKEIEARAAAVSIRPSLIRSPGRHADLDGSGPRRLLVGYTLPGRSWLAEGTVDSPADVLDLDWAALARGDASAFGFLDRTDRPHLLVCTNGTRDRCCALRGRPVAAVVAQSYPEQVWEATHTSGHRFAPTAALLPYGTLHGRLSAESATALLAAAHRGETVLDGARGRSTWPAAGQVAELAVREQIGELALSALTVAGDQDAWTVRHRDGRRWQVRTVRREAGTERAESCSKDPVPMTQITVDIQEATGG